MAGVQFEIIGKNWQLFIKKHWKAQARWLSALNGRESDMILTKQFTDGPGSQFPPRRMEV
jgi:hypothetical protein